MYNFLNGKYLVLDVETDGLDCHNDSLVSIAFYSSGKDKFIPIYHPENSRLPIECIEEIKKTLDKADIIVGHNIKFDLKFLQANKIDNWAFKNIWDTGIAEYILSGQEKKFPKLADLIKEYSDTQEKIDLELSDDIKASEYSLNVLKEYNIQDVKITDIIFKKQLQKAKQLNLVNLIFICSNFTKVLADIEYNGLKIDKELLFCTTDSLKLEIENIERELKNFIPESEYLDFNLNSNEHLSCILFGGVYKYKWQCELSIRQLKSGEIKIKPRNGEIPIHIQGLGFSTKHSEQTKNGYWSVSDEVIKKLKGRSKLQKDFIEKYKRYRKLQTLYEKFYTKYQDAISEDGYIYPNFNQTSTNTGRLSCSSPNVQQLPRADENLEEYQFKKLFISRYPDGYILDVDLSQLEWRVCAYLCQDPTMIQEIKEGVDAHKSNASLAFNIPLENVSKEQRQIAKMVSFGLIYGQTAFGLAKRSDIPIDTEEEAQKIIDTVYFKYPQLKLWHDRLYLQAMKSKKILSPSGRYFRFINPDNELTKIKNYPVQSFATADIAPLIFWKVWEYLKKKGYEFKIINTVHDCMVFDCKDLQTAKEISKITLDFFRKAHILIDKYFGIKFNVSLDGKAEAGKNWNDIKEVKYES